MVLHKIILNPSALLQEPVLSKYTARDVRALLKDRNAETLVSPCSLRNSR